MKYSVLEEGAVLGRNMRLRFCDRREMRRCATGTAAVKSGPVAGYRQADSSDALVLETT
jgi:hypothetical protein